MHMYKLPAACEARGQDVAGVGDEHEEREEEERGQRLGECDDVGRGAEQDEDEPQVGEHRADGGAAVDTHARDGAGVGRGDGHL